jgi:hypothetical protein
MTLSVTIPDKFFSEREKDKLKTLLNVVSDDEFEDAISKITLAALDEYKDMLLGSGLPSRADEIREHRLFHLIKRYFCGRLPSELEVSSMFQLTESRSKNLILYVITRFRYSLEDEITNTLRQTLINAEVIDGGINYRIFADPKNLVPELDRIVSGSGRRLRRLIKIRNEDNMYSIAPDSYEYLCHQLGIVIQR